MTCTQGLCMCRDASHQICSSVSHAPHHYSLGFKHRQASCGVASRTFAPQKVSQATYCCFAAAMLWLVQKTTLITSPLLGPDLN